MLLVILLTGQKKSWISIFLVLHRNNMTTDASTCVTQHGRHASSTEQLCNTQLNFHLGNCIYETMY